MKRNSPSVLSRACGAVVLVFLAVRLVGEWNRAAQFADVPSYKRVDWWLLSAACMQTRHAWLAVCGPNGLLVPIEDVSPTDDRGQTLWADALASVKKTPVNRTDLVCMNLALNVLGGCSVALFFFWGGLHLAAFGALLVTLWLFPTSVHFAGPDVPASFLGLYSLAFLPTLWLHIEEFYGNKGVMGVAFGFASFLALAIAICMRQAIGLIGIISLFVWIAYFMVTRRQAFFHFGARYILCAFLAGVVLAAPQLLISARTRFTSVPAGHLIISHGVAHAFYQGLGTEPNPWGIHYENDADGHEAVQKVNPQAGYGTPQYYHEIGKLYIQILMKEPRAVLRIYGHKLWQTLSLPLSVFGLPYIVYLVLAGVVLIRGGIRGGAAPLSFRVATAWMGYLVLFLLQGVLISPEIRFLYPAKFAVIVLLFLVYPEPDKAGAA